MAGVPSVFHHYTPYKRCDLREQSAADQPVRVQSDHAGACGGSLLLRAYLVFFWRSRRCRRHRYIALLGFSSDIPLRTETASRGVSPELASSGVLSWLHRGMDTGASACRGATVRDCNTDTQTPEDCNPWRVTGERDNTCSWRYEGQVQPKLGGQSDMGLLRGPHSRPPSRSD